MEKLPQIVTERLKLAAVSTSHPDADVLTALAEHSLAKNELATVLEHLARCADCREIVALALPETESLQETVRPVRAGRFAWPTLRWGLIAAGLVVIASFGVIEFQQQHLRTTATADKSTPDLSQNTISPSSQPAPAQESKNVAAAEPGDKASSDQLTSRKTGNASAGEQPNASGTFASRVRAVPTGGPLQSAPKVQFQQNGQIAQYQVPSTTPGAAAKQEPSSLDANSTAMAGAQSAASFHGSANPQQENVDLTAQMQPVQQIPPASADARVVRTKPAMAANAPPALSSRGPNYAEANASSPDSLVSWRVSDAGGLQRSFDQGSTWQDVNINQLGSSSGLMTARATSRVNGTSEGSLKKEASSPIFRSVSSNGTEIWAGASNALLYHSTDGGNTWTKVLPSASGIALTGDIVSVEFLDPLRGRLVTSTPETWTTSDAGQSWQKQ